MFLLDKIGSCPPLIFTGGDGKYYKLRTNWVPSVKVQIKGTVGLTLIRNSASSSPKSVSVFGNLLNMALYQGSINGRDLKVYENTDELSTDLAEYIAELSEAFVKDRGTFCIALSGGSLISLISKLCEAPYNKTVDWSKWYVFWADERVVAKTHVDSNYKLAKEVFLTKVPIVPSHVHSINDTVSAEKAAQDYEFVIRQFVRTRVINVSDISDCPKFDLILLGMGPDGHIASLFPKHPAVDAKEDWVTFITDSPKPPPERITFTLPVINSASNVAMVVTGSSKAETVRAVIDGVDEHNSVSLPAKMVQPINGKVVWFMDKDAASKLDSKKIVELKP